MFTTCSFLIFDLGGVLYDIEYEAIERSFAALQQKNNPQVRYSRQIQPEIFTRYEIGEASTTEFFDGLRCELGLDGTDTELASAWNSMLKGVYPHRAEQLARLKKRYSLALLSNTNELHINYVLPECQDLFGQFDYLFFSYTMGMRKPEPAIFKQVLEVTGQKPECTVFIDDSIQHLVGAETLGIHTLWLQYPGAFDLLMDVLLSETPRQI